jgi:hypothetical protein
VRVTKLVGVGLAIAALSACGASHRARPHDYSLRQVKHVFAAEGMPLRTARYGPAAGVVKLTNHRVEVEVEVGSTTTRRQSIVIGDLRVRGVGNVIVSFPASEAHAVDAALRSLET